MTCFYKCATFAMLALVVALVLTAPAHAGCKLFGGRKHRAAACQGGVVQYQYQSYQAVQYQAVQCQATYPVASVVPVVPTGQYTGSVGQAVQVPAAVPVVGAMGSAADFLSWLNSTRAAYGLSAVGYDAALEAVCLQNNALQAAYGLGHHYLGHASRQNSAGNMASPCMAWMNSSGHRAALLDPSVTRIGIAYSGGYWTFSAL